MLEGLGRIWTACIHPQHEQNTGGQTQRDVFCTEKWSFKVARFGKRRLNVAAGFSMNGADLSNC